MKGLVNPSPDDFDPLMFIHNQIVGKAIEAFGIAVMMPNEDGSERCPLCTFEEDHIARCQTPGCTFSHAELAIKNTLDWAQNYIREHLEAAEG